jgi:integrase
MVTSFPFSEPKIKALKPPITDDPNARDFYKDTKLPGLQVAAYPTGAKVYYYVRRVDGKPTRIKLGTTAELSVDQARTAAKVHAGKIAAGKNPQTERRQKRQEPTLQALWDHWLLYAGAHKKPRSVEEDKRNWRLHLAPWANRRLGTIKKPDVQSLHSRLGTDSGIYAGNRVLALLRAMLNKAEEIGYRGDNPARGVKMFKETARDRFLQSGEMEAFFQALQAEPEIFRDFFLTALLTGARKSNVLSMRWLDLDLTAGYWRIPETKGGIPVIVPLVAPAVSILESRRKATASSEWVFPGHRRGTHLQNPQKAWARVLKAAKLEDLRPHDLRRSLGSHMACQNVSATIIGKVLGHRPGSAATAVYARLSVDPQRHAMEGATTAMLTAGKQTKLLTIDATATAVE